MTTNPNRFTPRVVDGDKPETTADTARRLYAEARAACSVAVTELIEALNGAETKLAEIAKLEGVAPGIRDIASREAERMVPVIKTIADLASKVRA
jgi:CTP:molybdopterin cytidylyltransferase MocA